MNNDFEQPQQFPQEQPQWEQQSQYGQQPQQFSQGQPQWEQQSQYGQPQQFSQGQPQWGQQQYGPVPSYAQAQPGDNTTTNWLMGWLAYRAIIRIAVPIVIILLILGACVFFGLLSAVMH